MKIQYHFSPSTRYITSGIHSQIPPSLILKLWAVLDGFLATQVVKDYLQVFNLTITPTDLELEHFQEEPNYRQTLMLGSQLRTELVGMNPSNKIKIYLIDDVDHSTMLLAEEY